MLNVREICWRTKPQIRWLDHCTLSIAMTIFVGNLNYKASESELSAFFSENWQVKSVTIPKDRESGLTRGFAFVDLASDSEEDDAIDRANGADFMGRPLRLDKAKPRR